MYRCINLSFQYNAVIVKTWNGRRCRIGLLVLRLKGPVYIWFAFYGRPDVLAYVRVRVRRHWARKLYDKELTLGVDQLNVWQAELTFIHFSDIQNNYSRYPKKNLWYLKMYFGYPKYCHINFGYLKKNSGYQK